MTSEEKFIMQQFGRQETFTTPDGYFEHLEDKLCAICDEHPAGDAPSTSKSTKTPRFTLHINIRRVAIAAACLCGAVFCGSWLLNTTHSNKSNTPLAVSVDATDDSSLDIAMDYAMLDNEDMYAYIVE